VMYVHATTDSPLLSAVKDFKRIVSSYLLFHMTMLGAIVLQWILFLSLMTFAPRSAYLAFSLATLVLFVFSYLVLTYYFQSKKPDQFLGLREAYLDQFRDETRLSSSEHLHLANAAFQFVTLISQNPGLWQTFAKVKPLEKINAWIHYKDLYVMQEMLMCSAITEHIALIMKQPMHVEGHSSLANAYIALAKLYSGYHPFFSYFKEELRSKRDLTYKLAIEELKILNYLAPDDSWVHAQLASCYHDLEMREDEIAEYEILQKLRPDDREILFRLGTLYFESRQQAMGLEMYESLKEMDAMMAQELVSSYDVSLRHLFS